MKATITIEPRTVEHNDADAAGFTEGYWWILEMPDHPEVEKIESGAPTREAALREAALAAFLRGAFDDTIIVE
jgi:hypothetical protein